MKCWCGEPATISKLRDPFGKSDALDHYCAAHTPPNLPNGCQGMLTLCPVCGNSIAKCVAWQSSSPSAEGQR